jgi:long-chain acyl-CoA synthetase
MPAAAAGGAAGAALLPQRSAALPPEHLRSFERKFGLAIIETMGLTETVAPSFSNPLEAGAAQAGRGGPRQRLRGTRHRRRAAARARRRHRRDRHPRAQRDAGYYKNPEATAASFTPDGWLRTGDLGHRDGDGFFFVTGRIKELIIKGGENIAPREIDEALLKHPAVLDAAVVGMPDRHYGQEILACVVLREGATPDEADLRAFCERTWAATRRPSGPSAS